MHSTEDDEAVPGTESPRLEWLAICLGGALGACLRHAVHLPFEPRIEDPVLALVLPTLIVNAVGAGLLGHLTGRLSRQEVHALTRPFLAVGVLGSFTTYSSLILQSSLLTTGLGLGAATIHFAASGLIGLLAFAAGQASARAPA